jgi:hypothetical protein
MYIVENQPFLLYDQSETTFDIGDPLVPTFTC